MTRARGFGRAFLAGDAAVAPNLAPAFDGTDAKDRHRAGGKVVDGGRHRQVGIARQIVLRQDDVLEWLRFAAQEPVAPVVKRVPELDRAGDRFKLAGHRIEPKIAVAYVNGLGLRIIRRPDEAAVPRRRTIDLVVEPPDEIVKHRLLVARAKARIDFAPFVGNAVAVRVLQIPDVRGRGDEHAAFPRRHARCPEQFVGEHRAFVEDAVAVRVAQEPD